MGSLPYDDNAPPLGTRMTFSSVGMGRQDTTEETPIHRPDQLLTARGASVPPAPRRRPHCAGRPSLVSLSWSKAHLRLHSIVKGERS